MTAPQITVIICTHNRAHDAVECLQSVVQLASDVVSEILLVDSASAPEHAIALRKAATEHPRTRYMRLDVPGLSLARNKGAEEAQTDWLAYLDDDALVQPSWARGVAKEIANAPINLALIGGKIIARYPVGADTSHITTRWKLLLSCVDTDAKGLVAAGFNVCGANLLIRKQALSHCSGFPVDLGRVGDRLLSGEESYLIDELHIKGFVCSYSPSFAVWHKIPSARLTLEWVGQRAYWESISRVIQLRRRNSPVPFSMWRPKLWLSMHLLRILPINRSDAVIRSRMAQGAFDALEMRD